MGEGAFIQKPVEVLPFGQLQAVFGPQKLEDGVSRQGGFTSPDQELGAAAGREDDDFLDAFRALQAPQYFVAPVFSDPKPFSHGQRGCPVVHSDHDESRFQDDSSSAVALMEAQALGQRGAPCLLAISLLNSVASPAPTQR